MMNVNSVYTALANLAGRKTVSGLITFNNLVKAGLVHFLSAKEEKEAKTVTVNVKELAEARESAEKALAAARAVKGYRAAALVAEWVSVALEKAYIFISDCGYGITQQVVKKLREEFTLTKEDEPRAAFDPVSHYSYRDSRNGVFFIE